jgi:PPOX class probable F420-dependent enzyme
VDRDEARNLAAGARVARLATQTRTGRIDLVPMTFAIDGDRLVTAIDHKPKTTTALKRLENIRANPEVSVIIDEYDDADWDQLWWVRLRGVATIIEPGAAGTEPLHRAAVASLVAKYPQYVEQPPAGPVILIELVRWQWWSARPSPRA